ncbi:unnamed protein product [Didymodactylos carnosus]|uniref:Uncharacterized protein n=1 Tax=Didymodactylos carnosus TaxID=1234261 RepID=A0A8S2SL59_9BILA|nr:unnamed protein product [Didymodactylos carnosus]CAF4227341.1 unnamed protein product [Didymodactylos carnosus]
MTCQEWQIITSILTIAFNKIYPLTVYLLVSTMIDTQTPDMVIIVKMTKDFNKIDSVRIKQLPTQSCAAHRLVLLKTTAFVTDLKTLKFARIPNT